MTKPGSNYGDYGHRLAAIYLRRGEFYVQSDSGSFCFYRCAHSTIPIEETSMEGHIRIYKGPFVFEFIQKENEKHEIINTITFNGKVVRELVNPKPLSVKNVELYVSSYRTRHPALDCNIDLFKLQTGPGKTTK